MMSKTLTTIARLSAAAAIVACGLSASDAKATTTWSWSFAPSPSGPAGFSGTLTTAATTSASTDSFLSGVTGYLASTGTGSNGAVTLTLDTTFVEGTSIINLPGLSLYYDNLIGTSGTDANTGAAPGKLDSDGLLFSGPSNTLYNFYFNGQTYQEDVYTFSDSILNIVSADSLLGSFTVGVPEPASMTLLAAGLFGLGAYRRRKSA